MGIKLVRISPSILCVDYNNKVTLNAVIDQLEHSTASFIHLDIMDGKFVKNTSFDYKMVEYVKNRSTLLIDVHLMIEHPENEIDKYIKAGADIITVHYEGCDDLISVLKKIKSKNILAGVAINPKTPAYKIKDLVKKELVDLVLVMGVEAGKYGQTFIPGSAEKVAEVREMDKNVLIEIDGGVNIKNAKILRLMGVNIIVSGSTIFNSKNINKTIRELKGNDHLTRFLNLFKKEKEEE